MILDEFAAARRSEQDEAIDQLLPFVERWIAHPENAQSTITLVNQLQKLYFDTYTAGGGDRRPHAAPHLMSLAGVFVNTKRAVTPTTDTSDPLLVATWLAVSTLNAAHVQAARDETSGPVLLEWTTMHDNAVRPAHVLADGQRRTPGTVFTVGGENLRFPGDPRGSLDNVINCRCVLRPVALTAAAKEPTMPTPLLSSPLSWHGVLAPEDEWSGDGRRFSAGALRNRDLPLPLTWQRATSDGHDGSVVVGRIDQIERVDNLIQGEGVFIDTPETDEVIGLIAEFGKFGVSIDADDSEFEFDEQSNKVTFTSARIASASLVSIPAFASAYVSLGSWADSQRQGPPFQPAQEGEPDQATECDPEAEDYEDCLAQKAMEKGKEEEMALEAFVSDKPWSDFTQADYTDEQWKRACVLDKGTGEGKSRYGLPIKEPGGALNRNGVHAAAARFNQVNAPAEAKAKAKAKLRGAYRQLGEQPPDVLKASLDEVETAFGRGPGWITNPEDTRRIWAYWTQPGHEGYAKINWGTPGDFNRCRVEVGEEIGENSPETLRFLNQICAQWHHDATGFWPGRAPTEQVGSADLRRLNGPALTLVAGADVKAPAAWFSDPKLPGPTHLTVTEEGRVYGHIAEWKTCHIGYDGVCVAPPASPSGYAYYATGSVLLDNGQTAQTGVISIGGGHAGARLGTRAAVAHYDSTSSAIADVSVGEDEHGIWCAGWIRPGVDDNQVAALRASDVSGDWREIGGNLELVAALAVNVAGFPVAAVRNKTQVALVAAGVVETPEDRMQQMIEAAMGQAVTALFNRRNRMEKLKERVAHGV